jgi:Ca2+-binding RTX toxin-like protein
MTIKIGTNTANSLSGTSLADLLDGWFGSDTFTPGNGNDVVAGWFGNDVVKIGSGNAAVQGGAGTDRVEVGSGDWAILPGFEYGASLVNLATGQRVSMYQVEEVKIGGSTYKFVSGSDNKNTIEGGTGMDFIHGRDGDDSIKSGSGNDWVSGGLGSDRIDTGAGNDVIDESSQQSSFSDETAVDRIIAGSGNDTILISSDYLGSKTYNIDGGADNDIVFVDNSYFTLNATYSEETKSTVLSTEFIGTQKIADITGVEQIVNTLTGTVLNFVDNQWVEGRNEVSKTGTSLSETILGGTGSDTLDGNGGYDYFRGGAGTDTVILDGRADFYSAVIPYDDAGVEGIDLFAQFDPRTPKVNIGLDVEKIRFTNGDGADSTYNFVYVSGGSVADVDTSTNDFVVVDGINTMLDADARVRLNSGDDRIQGQGAILSVDGGNGDDYISWSQPAANTKFYGGEGDDQISVLNDLLFNRSTAQAVVAGTITVDGGEGDDSIYYSGYSNALLKGGDGDDQITTSQFGTVEGGKGNDFITVSFNYTDGDEFIGSVDGESGDDVAGFSGTSSEYEIVRTSTGFTVSDKHGGMVALTDIEAIKFNDRTVNLEGSFSLTKGSSAETTKTGGSGIDLMHGGGGKDVFDGGKGDDTLSGDSGSDTLKGNDGDDFIEGGSGSDNLYGGKGFDLFYYNLGNDENLGNDTIRDFDAGSGQGDVLAFSSYDSGFDSWVDVLAHAEQVGGDTVITIGEEQTITVKGVGVEDFSSDDFYFF